MSAVTLRLCFVFTFVFCCWVTRAFFSCFNHWRRESTLETCEVSSHFWEQILTTLWLSHSLLTTRILNQEPPFVIFSKWSRFSTSLSNGSNISCNRRRQGYDARGWQKPDKNAKAPCKWTRDCWMLHVASICTPCCILLCVFGSCCAVWTEPAKL